MKNKLLHFTKKAMGIIPAFALLLAVQSVASTCFFCLHQPNVPDELVYPE